MPRRLWFHAFLVLFALSPSGEASGPQPSSGSDPLETALRDAVLVGASGTPFRLANYRGEVIVLDFWATGCKPCRREMLLLDRLHQRISASSGRVIAVSVDRDLRQVARFVKEHALHLPMVIDGPDGLAKELALDVLPYTILLDRSGRVIHAGTITETEWDSFEHLVERLLTEAAPAPERVPAPVPARVPAPAKETSSS